MKNLKILTRFSKAKFEIVKIDELRGVDTSYQLRKLIAKGFIKECGKANLPGRPTLYKTTSLFLDYFGMSTIEDLPKIEIEEEIDKDLLIMALDRLSEREKQIMELRFGLTTRGNEKTQKEVADELRYFSKLYF